MIYKNKRIAGLNIYKIKGAKSYMLVEDGQVRFSLIGDRIEHNSETIGSN